MRPRQVRYDFTGFEIPYFQTFGARRNKHVGMGCYGEHRTIVSIYFAHAFPFINRILYVSLLLFFVKLL